MIGYIHSIKLHYNKDIVRYISGVHVALLPRSSSRINISAILNNGLQLNGGLFINYNEYTISRDKVSCKQWTIIDEDEYIRMQVRE